MAAVPWWEESLRPNAHQPEVRRAPAEPLGNRPPSPWYPLTNHVPPVSDQRIYRSENRCRIVRARRSEPAPRMVRDLRAAALFPLPNGLNITSDLIQVRKVVAGQHSQHHAQGLRATLTVPAGALQIHR